jgi:hypothetical protein
VEKRDEVVDILVVDIDVVELRVEHADGRTSSGAAPPSAAIDVEDKTPQRLLVGSVTEERALPDAAQARGPLLVGSDARARGKSRG